MNTPSFVAVLYACMALAAPPAAGAAQHQSRQSEDQQRASAATTAASAPAGATTEADRTFNFAATRVDEAPTIDGVIDEAVWRRAVVLTDFIQAAPDEGRPATERTEVRVLYDDTAIYIAAINYDREPERIIANVLRRDEQHRNNDSFMVTLHLRARLRPLRRLQ